MPATAALFRKLALGLPGAVESAHMGHPDFRVLCADGKLRIFATLSAEVAGRGVLKLTVEQQSAFREEMPEVFEPCAGSWGRMGMTYVTLAAVEEAMLKGALANAHRNVTASSMKNAAAKKTVRKKTGAKKATAKPKMKS